MAAFECRYSYRVPGLQKAPAEVTGRVFEALANSESGLSPRTLVDASRDVNAPLHNEFEWRDDVAAEVGCHVIVGSMRKHIPDQSQREKYLAYHRDAILELADYAKDKGVHIWVENILSFISNFLNTMKEVEDFVVETGRDNVGVHMDTYSMNMEDNDIYAAMRYCAPHLEYVHFSDTARRHCGGGNVDFQSTMDVLKEIDYKGYITVECIPWPTQFDCAKRSIDYMRAMETVVDIRRSASLMQ